VVFGSLAGVLALAGIIFLSVWMYRRFKEDGEKDQKWTQMPKEDKWDLNSTKSANSNSFRAASAASASPVSPAKSNYDSGGLNTTSYGYTNPVASASAVPGHRPTPSLPSRAAPQPATPTHHYAYSAGGGGSQSRSPPPPPARTATNTTNESNSTKGRTLPPVGGASLNRTPPARSVSPLSPSSPTSTSAARAPPPKPTGARPGSPTGGASAAGGRGPPPKPPGGNPRNAAGNWVKKWDSNHKHFYYWNKVTNVSQWNAPVGFVDS